jgi:hypothetical protein
MNYETELVGRSDAELGAADPLVMNLVVARGIPGLSHIDVDSYSRLANRWAEAIGHRLVRNEPAFWRTPHDWDNDVHQFRLGVVCQFVHEELGIRYREDQKDAEKIRYTDPCDLFVNGVMDTRGGTCGNLATLHVALGWRLGWPVSLALAGWHCIVRFDNGEVVWNIEASNTEGGFRVNPDSFYQKQYNVPQEHVACGSDLTFLKPRQLLGLFFGWRGRYWWDNGEIDRAKGDFLVALDLFPQSALFRRKARDCDLWKAINTGSVVVSMT